MLTHTSAHTCAGVPSHGDKAERQRDGESCGARVTSGGIYYVTEKGRSLSEQKSFPSRSEG